MTCYHCKRKANMRLWKHGVERWCYVPYRSGLRMLKRWWCSKCEEFIDAEYPEEDK